MNESVEMSAFIGELNGDVAREYAAAIQYLQHASTLSGVHFAFTQELFDHAEDEIGHAKKLNEYINFIGGIPLTMVSSTVSSSSSVAMLQQDKTAEEDAIRRYKLRITQAKALGLDAGALMLTEILKEEEGHLNDLRSILG